MTALLATLLLGSTYRDRFPLPAPVYGQGLGVNIHFTHAQNDEVALIRAGGFRWVRMDLFWSEVEKEKGKYDFSGYDRLYADLAKNGVRPLFILCYGNDLYEKGAPKTAESRAAFCRFVAATLKRYGGRGAVWEMWNEPNLSMFWQPKADAKQYAALALEVGRTVRRVAPQEWYVGPGVSGFDLPFLEECLKAGALRYWDAVSVHPYRANAPETALTDWERLRSLVGRYAGGRRVPLLSSEWGYSEKYAGLSRERQGWYAPRQYLTNLMGGANLHIQYDWRDDGDDPNEVEHHFGMVTRKWEAKPAYQAFQTLDRELGGFRYIDRLWVADGVYAALFRKGTQDRLVYWTGGDAPISFGVGGPRLQAGPAPQVAPVSFPNVRPLAEVQTLADLRKAGRPFGIYRNDQPVTLDAWLKDLSAARYEVRFGPFQRRTLAPRYGLTATLRPSREGALQWLVINGGPAPVTLGRSRLGPGEQRAYPFADRLDLNGPDGSRLVARATAEPVLTPGGVLGASVGGDEKVSAEASATAEGNIWSLRYRFAPGWRYAEFTPAGSGRTLPLGARVGMWVEGDGSGHKLRMRFQDQTGQTFQPDGPALDWTGWQWVEFPVEAVTGHWGGAGDGVPHAPLKLQTLLVLDSAGGNGGEGTIRIQHPTVIVSR